MIQVKGEERAVTLGSGSHREFRVATESEAKGTQTTQMTAPGPSECYATKLPLGPKYILSRSVRMETTCRSEVHPAIACGHSRASRASPTGAAWPDRDPFPARRDTM